MNDLAATCRTTIGNKISGCVVEFHPKKGVTWLESEFGNDLHVLTWNLSPGPAVKSPLLFSALRHSNLCITVLDMQKGLPGDD